MQSDKDTHGIHFEYIAYIESPYKEKFAIPRQPGLVTAAKGKIILDGEANNIELVRELDQFSHLWLLFVFHGTKNHGWKPLVRPPRLGGNKKTGVFATRTTFRPNPVGMSVVKLDKIEQIIKSNIKQVVLHISGLDLLDKTPLVDIKPYIPYSDALPEANAGFAQHQPLAKFKVVFSQQAMHGISKYETSYNELGSFITQVLTQDPRPAYKRKSRDDKIYGMSLYDLNITWHIVNSDTIEVLVISKML